MTTQARAFVDFALAEGVLRFGEFRLKSGRASPYFFNAGLINRGPALRRLGAFYAQCLVDSGLPCDLLFGPAYKGIPLAVATAMALAEHHGRDVPFAANRKEAKDHGEGGSTFGAALEGRTVIVDDVVSAGTSVAEAVSLLRAAGARPVGVLIALDREERGAGSKAATAEVTARHGIPVCAIARLADVVAVLESDPGRADDLRRLAEYRAIWGAPATVRGGHP